MAGLDSILGFVIPAGIMIFIIIKIYGKMSKDNPDWFRNFKDWVTEKTARSSSTKIDPMHEGSIRYAPG